MRAGRLKHRIEIDEPVTTQTASGDEVVTWTAFGTVWGSIEPLKGRERLQAGEIIADMDTRINIRWSAHVDRIEAGWRLKHGGVIYNISSPPAEVMMEQREIEMMCKSGANDG